jgi:hypothetical protein
VELQLFVSHGFLPCRDAERIWREVSHERDIRLTVVDIDSPAGRDVAARIPVTVVPAIAAAGRLLAVGVQTLQEARDLVAAMGNTNVGTDVV